MDRRQFVSLLGLLGTTAWVNGAPSQAQTAGGRRRLVGLMLAIGETDPEGARRVEAFRTALVAAGWAEGRNVELDVRWYKGNFQLAQVLAKSLVERGVDAIVVNGTPGMDAVRELDTKIPVVFVVVSNPVGAGYVPSLSRPGGSVTGFSTFEPEMAGKWLQLLVQLVPDLKHVSMLLDPKFVGFKSLWQAIEEMAPRYGIAPHPAYASSLAEIERELEIIKGQQSPGLIVSPSPVNTVNRQRLIAMANAYRIPAIYPFRFYVQEGALIAYGFNAADQFRRAAIYIGRILNGEKAGDLPVQAPSLFELGINLRTAKSMGLPVPQSLLIASDEVIE